MRLPAQLSSPVRADLLQTERSQGSLPPASRRIPQPRTDRQIEPVATIYMPLLNEGSPCARPVEAVQERDGCYRVEGPVPDDEEWEFDPGANVVCEWTTFADGQQGLLALRLAE